MRSDPALELLVVDGYNVIYGTPRYAALIDEPAGRRLGNDPFDRAREALVADVAAFAARRYDPVVVFDGSGNVDPDRPDLTLAGVPTVFSAAGEQADAVIERLVRAAREKGRPATVVTSDATVQATVYGPGVTRVSSRMLAGEVDQIVSDNAAAVAERTHGRMTVEDRLDPETLRRLNGLIGR
jgi:predicted RNA-binding protein with PIN domain